MKIERRIATEEDLDTLYEINVRAMKDHIVENFGAWDENEQREHFRKTTDLQRHELLLIDSEPVGFVNIVFSDGSVYLNRLCIVPEHQGNGIGTAIIQEMIASNGKSNLIRLQVFPRNPALKLYQRLGFRETKRTPTHIHMVYAFNDESMCAT